MSPEKRVRKMRLPEHADGKRSNAKKRLDEAAQTERRSSMKTVVLSERSRDPLLHVETPLGIVNIRVGLHDAQGRPVVSIETIPNTYTGEPRVARDGYANTRLIQETDDAPFCPACGSHEDDCADDCPILAETRAKDGDARSNAERYG